MLPIMRQADSNQVHDMLQSFFSLETPDYGKIAAEIMWAEQVISIDLQECMQTAVH